MEVVKARRQQVKELLKETHETRHRTVNEQLVELDNQTTQLIAIREQLEDATCKGDFFSILFYHISSVLVEIMKIGTTNVLRLRPLRLLY